MKDSRVGPAPFINHHVKVAVLCESAFTDFWLGAPPETLAKIMPWDGSLAVLYRSAFVASAAIERAVRQLTHFNG